MSEGRRAIWIFRLVFYPAAIALVVVALQYQPDGASADDDDATGRRPEYALLVGNSSQGEPVSARYQDGAAERLVLPIVYTCTPDVGSVWAVYVYDDVKGRGGEVTVRDHGTSTTWGNGWAGTGDVDVDGGYDEQGLGGRASATMTLDANGVRADCRAAPFTFGAVPSEGRRGTTAQNEPVTALVRDGALASLTIGLHVTCSDGVGRRLTWRPQVGPGDGLTVERDWTPVGVQREILVRPEAPSSARAERWGRSRVQLTLLGSEVHGTATARMSLGPRGPFCETPSRGVTFVLGA